MAIRMTGMISGLDTESLIQSLVEAQKLKNKKTTDKKIKELVENDQPSYEKYAKLKVLEKNLAQAEVLEKDIDTQFLLSERYIFLTEVIFRFIRELP